MTLELPPDIEAIAKEKAALAGIADVETFVQRLIKNASPEQALLPPPGDARILAAISEGFASGVAGEMDEEFWRARRDELEEFIAAKHGPDV